MKELILRRLITTDEKAFFSSIREWNETETTNFCVQYSGQPFSDFLSFLSDRERGINLPPEFVPHIVLFGFVDGVIVGRLNLRASLTIKLSRYGGNIGYAVIGKYRRQGYGSEMLRQALQIYCRDYLELQRVMLTCDIDNVASYKVMEKNGCYLNDVFRENGILTRQYLIEL